MPSGPSAHGVHLKRSGILEAAACLLSAEGPAGLTVRRVAAAAGGSTQMVYTLFGGKPGLAAGLHSEGFSRLGAAMDAQLATAPPPGDPDRLVSLGRAYCGFAVAEPAFFSVMFTESVAGFVPDARARGHSRSITLGRVEEVAAECLAAGTLTGADAETVAHCCWATAHGLAGLLVSDLLPVDSPYVEEGLRAMVRAFETSAVGR